MSARREDWTLDSEGGAYESESTYRERMTRANDRIREAARDARESARNLIDRKDRRS